MFNYDEINIELKDTMWEKTTCQPYFKRNIVRAIVYLDGYYYFAHIERDDQFASYSYIETSGGGVENNETLEEALKRELKEELGFEVQIIAYLGFVSDYYNLINRNNLNHYYLVKPIKEVKNHLMPDEINDFHLTKVKYTYFDTMNEYLKNRDQKLGFLIYNREVRILELANKIIQKMNNK